MKYGNNLNSIQMAINFWANLNRFSIHVSHYLFNSSISKSRRFHRRFLCLRDSFFSFFETKKMFWNFLSCSNMKKKYKRDSYFNTFWRRHSKTWIRDRFENMISQFNIQITKFNIQRNEIPSGQSEMYSEAWPLPIAPSKV